MILESPKINRISSFKQGLGKLVKRISNHLLIVLVSVFLTVICNRYFFAFIAPLCSKTELFLIGLFLFAFFGLCLEVLAMGRILKPMLILILAICASSSYLINSLQTGFTPDIFHSIINTNTREVSETLNASFIFGLLFLFLLPSLYIYFTPIKTLSLLKAFLHKLFFIAGYSCLILFLWFGLIGKEITFLFKQNRALYYLLNPISPIRSAIQYFNEQSKRNLIYTQVALDATIKPSNLPKIIVLVIGESARSQNFSLNGYSKETNPYTSKQSNLISFKDFSACGVITAISVPCMLMDYTHQTYTKRYLSDFRDNLLTITQRIGIKTYYIGNNGGGCIGNICAKLPKDQIKLYEEGNLDEVMLKDLDQILSNAKGNTFIILHQTGSHGQSYFKRYPKEFRRFIPTCDTAEIQNCSLESLENTYDNTLLYTDYFLKESIQKLQTLENRFDVALWYISDHGESLGENGMYMHGGLPYFLAPATQTQVPSILWLGKGFEWAYQKAKTRENDPLSQDYVFHTLIRLWGIQTKDYDSKLDLFH